MDDIVRQAMAKWPDVPDCYDWLMLDARGAWRIRDEAAQALNVPGDRIAHTALVAFINRNYGPDACGRWYFQNGPQRVYVNLEATPYIARTAPGGKFQLHTEMILGRVDTAWLTESGEMLLCGEGMLAQVDDRDLVECLPELRLDGDPVDDARLLEWIAGHGSQALTLYRGDQVIPVNRITADAVATTFGFVRMPTPGAR